ncbi:hypothetical protein L249_7004 [Ophiocordyceps polyrhachis-furcata BCC 54312]|uniref:Uncharacterized protein n=1 Tax=Ophiocordyceps polyrhachis-furcata BCC 54312 TaxID=1330021 RepID=A0A367LLI1_9HYPO|nr:hypothetical protein L249_7004 [Ophiocordyceps polyrhachis-furcata BCC 54312]
MYRLQYQYSHKGGFQQSSLCIFQVLMPPTCRRRRRGATLAPKQPSGQPRAPLRSVYEYDPRGARTAPSEFRGGSDLGPSSLSRKGDVEFKASTGHTDVKGRGGGAQKRSQRLDDFLFFFSQQDIRARSHLGLAAKGNSCSQAKADDDRCPADWPPAKANSVYATTKGQGQGSQKEVIHVRHLTIYVETKRAVGVEMRESETRRMMPARHSTLYIQTWMRCRVGRVLLPHAFLLRVFAWASDRDSLLPGHAMALRSRNRASKRAPIDNPRLFRGSARHGVTERVESCAGGRTWEGGFGCLADMTIFGGGVEPNGSRMDWDWNGSVGSDQGPSRMPTTGIHGYRVVVCDRDKAPNLSIYTGPPDRTGQLRTSSRVFASWRRRPPASGEYSSIFSTEML